MKEVTTAAESQELIPLKAEIATPTADWSSTWSLVRRRGLSPELSSFLFKLLHNILPNAVRLHRILPNSSSLCSRCNGEADESLSHALIQCSANGGVGRDLLGVVSHYTGSDVSMEDLLAFNFARTNEVTDFGLTWFIGTVLSTLWSKRCDKKKATKLQVVSELQVNLKIFEKTSMVNEKIVLRNITNFYSTVYL